MERDGNGTRSEKLSIRIPSVGSKKSRTRKKKGGSGLVHKRKTCEGDKEAEGKDQTTKVPRLFCDDNEANVGQSECDAGEGGLHSSRGERNDEEKEDEAFEEALLRAVPGSNEDDDGGSGSILLAMHSLEQKGCAVCYSVSEEEGAGVEMTVPLVLKSMVHTALSSSCASSSASSTVASAMSSTVVAEQIEDLAQRNVLRALVLTLDQQNDEEDGAIAIMESHHYRRVLRAVAAAHDVAARRMAAAARSASFATTTISTVVKAVDVVEWLIQTVLPRCSQVSVKRHQLEQLRPAGLLDKYIDCLVTLGILRPKRLSSSSSSSRRLLDSAQGTDLVWYWSLPSMGTLCRTILAGRRRLLQRLRQLSLRQGSSSGGGPGLQRSVLERRPVAAASSEESPCSIRIAMPAAFVVRDLLSRQAIQLYYSPSGEAYIRLFAQRTHS